MTLNKGRWVCSRGKNQLRCLEWKLRGEYEVVPAHKVLHPSVRLGGEQVGSSGQKDQSSAGQSEPSQESRSLLRVYQVPMSRALDRPVLISSS